LTTGNGNRLAVSVKVVAFDILPFGFGKYAVTAQSSAAIRQRDVQAIIKH
jgi:hypothetical protein